MILRSNRFILSETTVFRLINSDNKMDLTFLENPINIADLDSDIQMISQRNYPFVQNIINALQSKQIVLTATENKSTSIIYIYGSDSSKSTVTKVFVNLSRFIKSENAVNSSGDIIKQVRIQGGYEVLYDILLGAYIGLNAKRVYEANPTAVKMLRDIYTDLFSQCMSRGKFGHPIDGEKFRFFIDFYFYNGSVSAEELAQVTKFPMDKARALQTLHPTFFQSTPSSLDDLIEVILKEFPSMSRNNLNTKTFVLSSVSTLGDSALYLLDNHAYLLSVVINKARRSKVFQGYLLKTIESDSARLQSTIFHSFL